MADAGVGAGLRVAVVRASVLLLGVTVGCSSATNGGASSSTRHDAGMPLQDAGSPARDAAHDTDKGDAIDAADASVACTVATMDFTGASGFFGSPFPSDARLTAAGTPDLTGFPNSGPSLVATEVLNMISTQSHAFGLTSSVYFQWSNALATTGLSDPHTSLGAGANVFILDVDPSSAEYGKRSAAKGVFLADGGPYGAPNLLAILPYPGISLLPATRYAAIVLRTQTDVNGKPVCPAPAMLQMVAGTPPVGMSATAFTEYRSTLAALMTLNIAPSDLAAMTVFTTDTPTAQFETVRNAMQALPVPVVSGPWTANEVFPTYCVFSNTIPMPEYQGGVPPYESSGGGWVFDSSGVPMLQRMELANIVVTIPRAPMPANGYPVVNMSRTGAGGNRPLVDRGQEAQNGPPSITPGTGPALYFAAAGFAGASVDGPLGGLRNPDGVNTDNNEDFTTFNVGNPEALRDNIRQSAAELSLTATILSSLSFDASSCPGATTPNNGPVSFDATTMALFSHSMGSTISPLTLAFEPRYRLAILSGAGGSWIDNVIYKLLPLPVKPAVELLLGISQAGTYSLGEGDPILNMFQWAAESADPPVYDSRTIHHPVDAPPRNVLKIQGIIDNYILPPICNATTLSLGLDLGGTELDSTNPGLSMFTPLGDVLDLSGQHMLTLPISGNISVGDGGVVTAAVTQHPSDGIEDGHEVIFQTDIPKHEYVCMLKGLAAGQVPRIPTDGTALSPCE